MLLWQQSRRGHARLCTFDDLSQRPAQLCLQEAAGAQLRFLHQAYLLTLALASKQVSHEF